MINHSLNPYRYRQMQHKARARGWVCMVGGLIIDDQGQLFIFQRAGTYEFFPGCWDIPGGQVKEGESLFSALARAIQEGTGWQLTDILEEVSVFEWEPISDKQGKSFLEFDFRVKVQGDLENPSLNADQASTFRWINPEDLDLLQENCRSESLDFLDGKTRVSPNLNMAIDTTFE